MVSLMNHTAGQCLNDVLSFPGAAANGHVMFSGACTVNRCERRACRFNDEQEFFSKLLFQIHLVQVTPGGDAEENKENAGEIPSWIFLTTTDVQSFGTQRIKNWSACLFFFDIVCC